MKILIIGGNGNMGRRYSCCLTHLKKDYIISEAGDKKRYNKINKADHIIITTPTDRHIDDISDIIEIRGKRETFILCEKPISKDIKKIRKIYNLLKNNKYIKLYMVNNYYHIPIINRDMRITRKNNVYEINDVTKYNYFLSGSDGLYYDCIQLIHLAKYNIKLSNDSPFYLCMINGYTLERMDVDISYVDMLEDFLKEKKYMWGLKDIKESHFKVERLINKNIKNKKMNFLKKSAGKKNND